MWQLYLDVEVYVQCTPLVIGRNSFQSISYDLFLDDILPHNHQLYFHIMGRVGRVVDIRRMPTTAKEMHKNYLYQLLNVTY